MPHPPPDPELAVAYIEGRRPDGPLLAEAARLRDEGKGRTVTYSRKVFIPLTTMCRDTCTYCTFVKPPGGGGEYLVPDDVMAIARAGARHGCTEALFTLGDRPEDRWQAARDFLAGVGHDSTIDYVSAMTERVAAETPLFPHANPGLMSADQLRRLRRSNPSVGLMLENISPRLLEPGGPHHGCPDKDPQRRMATIAAAGRERIPFTTGILVGIGETAGELVDSLFALERTHRTYGHIQEIIVQNFRAKANTRMRHRPEPTPEVFRRVVAVARWIMGSEMNIQVPPNLSEDFSIYLDAGINDWGGVSPLTIDWVNPEAPWPQLDRLDAVTRAGGFDLRARLPVYPEYISEEWIDAGLLAKVSAAVDDRGYVRPMEGARP